MNAQDRKFRFMELMSAVSMLPSLTDDPEANAETATEWVFPNLVAGFNDEKLARAILSQALRAEDKFDEGTDEGENFNFKLVAMITNSAMKSIVDKEENSDCSEDIEALGLALTILWSTYRFIPMMNLMGLVGKTCAQFGLIPPSSLKGWLHNPKSAEHYKKEDPLALLED